MTHLTKVGNPNVFASLPFDQIDGVAGYYTHEDFLNIGANSAEFADATGIVLTTIAEGSYWGIEIAGAGAPIASKTTGVADHPGILLMSTGPTTPADGDAANIQVGPGAAAVQDDVILDNNGWYFSTVVRVVDLANCIAEWGLFGQAPVVPNGSAADVVAFAYDPEDALNVGDVMWFPQNNAAGTDLTDVFDNATVVASDWILLEIGVTDTEATYRLTTEDATETISLTQTQPIVGMRQGWTVEAVGAAEETLEVDLWHSRYLRRDALVGQGSDWLGA